MRQYYCYYIIIINILFRELIPYCYSCKAACTSALFFFVLGTAERAERRCCSRSNARTCRRHCLPLGLTGGHGEPVGSPKARWMPVTGSGADPARPPLVPPAGARAGISDFQIKRPAHARRVVRRSWTSNQKHLLEFTFGSSVNSGRETVSAFLRRLCPFSSYPRVWPLHC